ncbi:MAG: Diguanylate cyclase DosC [Firmicutes bacterium ADurb.Bin146]|nr:MAG: Diguanylate cyclase DosC [Firmicutes bacterium ADurb.Bin146]
MDSEWYKKFSEQYHIDMDIIINTIRQIPICGFFKDTELIFRVANNMDPYVKKEYRNNIEGLKDSDVLDDEETIKMFEKEDKYILQTGANKRYIHKINIDSTIKYMDIFKKPIYNLNNEIIGLVCIIHDTTKSVEENIWIQEQLKLMSDITRIDKILLNIQKDISLIQDILRIFAEYCNSGRAYFIEFTDECRVKNTYEYCTEPSLSKKEHLFDIDMRNFPYWLEQFFEEKHIFIEDIETISEVMPFEYEYLKGQNIKSLYAVPIVVEDASTSKKKLVAFLGVDNPLLKKQSSFFIDRLAFSLSLAYSNYKEYNEILKMNKYDLSTNLLNRNEYIRFVNSYEPKKRLACVYIDVNGLHDYNNKYGHLMGDDLLKKVANALLDSFQGASIFRIGGDEFIVFCENDSKKNVLSYINEFHSKTEEYGIYVSSGLTYATGKDIDIHKMIKTADASMLENKRKFYCNLTDIEDKSKLISKE